MVVRYRTRDGAPGIDVVVPLVTADGTALLVDRGWMATDNSGADPPTPASPSGEVTVTGWVRQDASGDSTTSATSPPASISSKEIGSGARHHDVTAASWTSTARTPAPTRRWRRRSCPT